MEELIPLEIPVTPKTIGLIKGYANITGKSVQEVSDTLGAEVSQFLESRLNELVAYSVGATPASAVSVTHTTTAHTSGYAQVISKSESMIDGIGDQEPEDIPPSNELIIPRGAGLKDEDLDHDMDVDDPTMEAKATPQDLGKIPEYSEDIMAEAIGYEDNRLAKRKKRFGKGRGRVTALNEAVISKGADV